MHNINEALTVNRPLLSNTFDYKTAKYWLMGWSWRKGKSDGEK